MTENEPPQETQDKVSETYLGCRLCPTGLSLLGRAPRYINSRWMVVKNKDEPTTRIVSILHLESTESLSGRDKEQLRFARDFCANAIKIIDPILLCCGPAHDDRCPEGHLHFKVLPKKEVRDKDPTIFEL